jgi:hypothetical protein
MLQFYSASTNIVNSKRAITECLEKALGEQGSLNCDLLIIYSAMGHNFKDLLSEARKLSPSAEIIGCTAYGIIGREGPEESMKALAIMAIKGPGNEFAVASLDFSDKYDPYDYGLKLAEDLKRKNDRINMVLFHPSVAGTIILGRRLYDGFFSGLGKNIPIFGGLSSSGALASDFQFTGDTILENGFIAIGFADPELEIICRANHGLEIMDHHLEVTKAGYYKIFELEGKPAWVALMERLDLPVDSSPLEVMSYLSLAAELSPEFHEEYKSRYIVAAVPVPFGEGEFVTSVPVEKGTKLWLTVRKEKKIFEGVDKMTEEIVRKLDGKIPAAVFHSDCTTRGKKLFNRVMKEEIISHLKYPLCKDLVVPWLGMYAGGELCPVGGVNMMHFNTSCLYVMVRRK